MEEEEEEENEEGEEEEEAEGEEDGNSGDGGYYPEGDDEKNGNINGININQNWRKLWTIKSQEGWRDKRKLVDGPMGIC